ncbi:30S ribosomal protein S4 [Candidatus Norongarragalina meridionalis]|nr:30S ribosomal protein S4 [Candidatus Norongarragalina meridionalis]
MGDPHKKRKLYEKPKRLWDAKRIEEEGGLKEEYGLKNSREVWRMKTILRKIRREARRLLSKKGAGVDERAERLLKRVKSFLLKKPDASLDDVLALTTKDILERRLQTIVVRKKMALTMKQSRQYITHGHVAIGEQKVTAPSYLVKFGEEDGVRWHSKPIGMIKEAEAVSENG